MPVGGGGLTSSPGAVTQKLEADFSGTAFGGTPTWTNITGWWMSSGTDPGGSSATIPWGRQDQSTTVESSTTSFTLNNSDGRFTPGKVSSPYYPNVKRRVRMRHTITDGTTTLTLFDGYVDSWSVAAQTDGPTLATVSLSDGFARLSASTQLRSILSEEILLDGPFSYYPLTDAEGATAPAAIVGPTPTTAHFRATKVTGGSFSFGQGVGPAADGQPTLILTQASSTSGNVVEIEPWTSTAVGYAIRLAWSGTATSGWLVDCRNSESTITGTHWSRFAIGVSGGFATWDHMIATDRAPSAAHVTTVTVNDGNVHDFELVHDSVTGTGMTYLYVDGVLADSAVTGNPNPPTVVQVGGTVNIATGIGSNLVSGSYSHVAIFVGSLSDPANHYAAGKTGFAGETTSARWTRLLSYRPNLGGAATATMGTIGGGGIAGTSLGDALTDTAAAEGGVIQSNRGTLTLIGRSNWYDPATTLTLDAANGEVDLPTTWRDDTQGLVNDVTVDRPNGAAQRAVNAASVATDGVAQTSITANLNSDRDAADMAGWLVAVGVREQLDSPTLTVNLYARSSAVLTMAVCALKTYDVVTLTNLPASAPASTMTFQVQGGTYTVGANTFTAELYTTTMPPGVLRTDATPSTYTKLDSGLKFAW